MSSNTNPPSTRPMTLRQQQWRRKLSFLGALTDDQLNELETFVEWFGQEIAREARLNEAKQMERKVAKKFDELCERVRTDPNFGNSSKGKKDNFLDGAESMILLPSLRVAELTQKPPQEKSDV